MDGPHEWAAHLFLLGAICEECWLDVAYDDHLCRNCIIDLEALDRRMRLDGQPRHMA